jgi:RNA polymerase sigma-70 factor (ECF subfamily)
VIRVRAELEFDTFYAATRGRLLHQLTLMTLDREQAADALQEAYIKAWQRWDRIGDYDDAESWVRLVAYRHCISAWRRLATARRSAREIAAPESTPAPATAEAVAVRQALAQLSTDHRAVLVLHEMCDLSVEQIAAQLRIPPGTVKTRLMRGRAALAVLLTDPAEDAADGPHVADGRPAPASSTLPEPRRAASRPATDLRREVPDVV